LHISKNGGIIAVGGVVMTLKEMRKNKKLTQADAAAYLGVPLRTYINYENDIAKQGTIKYNYMLETLSSYGYIDEQNGVLTIEKIKNICGEVFKDYEVEYCYLFGSYAKGKATGQSDVDLLIATPLNGLNFFEMVELLREKLCKKVDALHQTQLNNNLALTQEILKDGIKIYG
jgi:predicted nucleotidyltransferase